ncbi:DUF3105 domain-containing protein [Nocardioides humilatus]|uniref:DUF3105 domain-containing protein n=1 Tax=Nocardioides humilatus TaxID=2607660 RepID=A0A5B1L6V4_9ACTN|nr:DUF3105 domain-containing protein [Nocardioides humilatus]KAA1416342.1 DUF3105 domain-containing protein [Nocardioides humilatus]
MTEPTGEPTSKRPLGVAVAVGAGVLVVVGAVVLPSVLGGDDESESQAPPASPGATVDTSNLALVQEYDLPPWHHTSDDVDYPQSPPVGGDHFDPWLECGVYDVPVSDELAVHDLEHASVWITYRPDQVDAEGVAELAGALPQNGIMSPYPTQEAPVVITAWARQLALIGPDDPRIALFIDKYGAGETAPEAFASCAGGTTEPTPGA